MVILLYLGQTFIRFQFPTLPGGQPNVRKNPETSRTDARDANFAPYCSIDLRTLKGSGGNGVNTVYFVNSTGTVCTNTSGVGLPAAGATLPTSPLAYDPDPAVIQAKGLDPNNMCILKGFPIATKSKTSISGSGDQSADPNKLVVVTDKLDASGPTPPSGESFATLRTAGFGEVRSSASDWRSHEGRCNGSGTAFPRFYR